MFKAILVALTFGAAKTANVLSKKSSVRDKKSREAGIDIKHREHWKTCALDAAMFVACCVAMGAAGVLTDEMRDQDSTATFKENISASQAQILH